jgi:hypothetical protein
MREVFIHAPDLPGADLTIVEWRAGPGQWVVEDQTLLLVRIGGQVAEVTSPVSGRLLSVTAPMDVPVEPGAVLASVDADAERQEEALAELEATAQVPHAPEPASAPSAEEPATPSGPEECPLGYPIWDVAALVEGLEHMASGGTALARIEASRRYYEGELSIAWTLYVQSVDAFADHLDKQEAEAAAAARRSHERREEALLEEAKSNRAERDRKLSALRERIVSELAHGLGAVREGWNKVGPGLQLPDPEARLTRERERLIAAGGGRAGNLTEIAKGAAALPQVPASGNDLFFTRYWWWAGLAGLAVFSGMTRSFSAGFLLAFLLVAAIVGLRHSWRAKAQATYEGLVTAVARHQAGCTADLETEAAAFEAAAARAAHEAEASRARSLETLTQELSDARDSADRLRRRAMATHAENVTTCRRLVEHLSQVIRDAIDEASDLLDAWGPHRSVAGRRDLDSAAERAIRLGEAVPPPLRRARLDANETLALSPGGPNVWRIGEGRSVLISGPDGDDHITALLCRVLYQLPPGSAHSTLFDPRQLGRSFAPFLKLGDISTQLVGGKVWTSVDQMRRKLKDLIEQVERVTQNHLRDQFPDIEAYNASDQNVPEPYRFLVIQDFPEGWDEDMARDLQRLLQNGPRCGLYVIAHMDTRLPLPRGVDLGALRPFFSELSRLEASDLYEVMESGQDAAAPQIMRLDPTPAQEQVSEIVGGYGRHSEAALNVKVPYRRLLRMSGEGAELLWARSSLDGICVPLGPSGKNVQALTLGTGLTHHGLLVGRPGSGKSNLLHVFITTAARLYSPSELQLFLIDFKQGVEFKPYADAKLPHAHVIAVQSEREFGLSVLQGLEATMAARGALFADAGVNNIAEYRRKTGAEMPRIVLVVDEFQEFFAREDRIKREAAAVTARLVSQARYSGIHLLFGTQSLATATLDRPIRDQMTVRIALQCSEADSRLILAEDNTAARLLTRPGEALYNNQAGRPEGNNTFQVALFSEEDARREVGEILQAAIDRKWEGEPPIVFQGHEPGDIRNCQELTRAATLSGSPRQMQLWLGESTSLRPVRAPVLKRQSGRNLLVLGRDERQAVGLMMAALMSLAAQCAPGAASFRIIDLTSADEPWADHPEEFAESSGHDVEVLGRHQVSAVLSGLEREVKQRVADEETARAAAEPASASTNRARGGATVEPIVAPPIFVVLLGAHRARDLRSEGGPSRFSIVGEPKSDARSALGRIIKDGPEVGVHVLVWCDAYANLERALDREALEEFGIKASGPLTDQESRRLFDDEAAALLDKPHRMVLGDDEQVGVVQTIRPFDLPTYEFMAAAAARTGVKRNDLSRTPA